MNKRHQMQLESTPVKTREGQSERILARRVARELTSEEYAKVAGGILPNISYVHGGIPNDTF